MAERMQQLLSRAVEDQLSEQRQLAGLLADIRMTLARIPEEIRSGAGSAIAEQVAGLQQGLDGLGARMDLISTRLAELATSDGLRAAVDRVEVLLSRTDALNGRVDGISARIDALGDPTGELRGQLEPVESRLVNTERRVQELSHTFADTERRLTEHIDEAVLALADALLRRRSRPGGGNPPAAAPPAPVPSGPADDEAPDAPEDFHRFEPRLAPEEESDRAEAGAAEDARTPAHDAFSGFGTGNGAGEADRVGDMDLEAGSDFEDLDLEEEVPLGGLASDREYPAEAPGPVPASTGGWSDLGDDDDQGRRRRPWWRPGE